jgi:hypothetical protein
VINGQTNAMVATIPVGLRPGGVAVNGKTNRVYVANARDGVGASRLLTESGRSPVRGQQHILPPGRQARRVGAHWLGGCRWACEAGVRAGARGFR